MCGGTLVKNWKNSKRFKKKLSNGKKYSEKKISRNRLWSWELVWEHWSELSNMKILEIGPRYSRWALREQLELNGCEYYSVTGAKKEIKKGNAVPAPKGKIKSPGNFALWTSDLTKHFEEDFFDVIIGIQSFEHWSQRLGPEAYVVGIEECGKILKSGGWFMQEIPVVGHGAGYFKYERWKELDKLFKKNIWGEMKIFEKGKDLVSDSSHTICKHSKNHPSDKDADKDKAGKHLDNFLSIKCSECCWNAMLKWQKL